MPNYPTHSRWGRIGSVVMMVVVSAVVYYTFQTTEIAILAGVFAAVTTFVGAIYPDIDHHASIPRRKAVGAFQFLLLVIILGVVAVEWASIVASVGYLTVEAGIDDTVPAEMATIAIVAASTIVAVKVVDPAIDRVTDKHRGWTHSVKTNASLIFVTVGVIWLATQEYPIEQQITPIIAAVTFFIGTLIHLGLDGEIR